MRPPRWVVVIVAGVSCATVVATACIFWAGWPIRTSFEFVRAMNEGSVKELPPYAPLLRVILESIGVNPSAFQEDAVVLKPRSFQDLVLARQTFTVRGVPYVFTASRGTVSSMPLS